MSFNLNLTPSQQESRAQVPLPYAHEGTPTILAPESLSNISTCLSRETAGETIYTRHNSVRSWLGRWYRRRRSRWRFGHLTSPAFCITLPVILQLPKCVWYCTRLCFIGRNILRGCIVTSIVKSNGLFKRMALHSDLENKRELWLGALQMMRDVYKLWLEIKMAFVSPNYKCWQEGRE